MKTYKRICIKDYKIEAENGDKLELKRGQEYITSEINESAAIGPPPEEGMVVVFSNFWVPVPLSLFAGEVVFTEL